MPVRTARPTKDVLTRQISDRFEEAGVEFASETMDVTLVRRLPSRARSS